MHALGQVHEQQRRDRDNHIIMHWNNIIDGRSNQNMEILSIGSHDRTQYDPTSSLQYSLWVSHILSLSNILILFTWILVSIFDKIRSRVRILQVLFHINWIRFLINSYFSYWKLHIFPPICVKSYLCIMSSFIIKH